MMKLLDNQRLDQQAVSDLRERAGTIAAQGDALLRRADHLPREDRLLIELSLRSQLSQRKLAALVGVPHGTVARRLKKLATRLRDPLVVRLLDGPCPLERTDRELAIGYFVQRRPLRELSQQHHLTTTQVSRRLQFVRGWFRGATMRRGE